MSASHRVSQRGASQVLALRASQLLALRASADPIPAMEAAGATRPDRTMHPPP